MPRNSCVGVWLLFLVATVGAWQGDAKPKSAQQFIGTWIGSWEGSGSGRVELTLEKGKDAPVSGRVSVTGETDYKAPLTGVAFEGPKMTAVFDFPPDPSVEVAVAATFAGKKADGTWRARNKTNGEEVASGTWSVTRQ